MGCCCVVVIGVDVVVVFVVIVGGGVVVGIGICGFFDLCRILVVGFLGIGIVVVGEEIYLEGGVLLFVDGSSCLVLLGISVWVF